MESLNLVECTNIERVINEITGKSFMRASFTEVKGEFKNRTIYGTKKGTKLFNPGKETTIGGIYEGKFAKLETTPYDIEGNTVTSITVFCLDDETPLEVANAQLKRNRASVVINGKPTVIYESEPVAGQVVVGPQPENVGA